MIRFIAAIALLLACLAGLPGAVAAYPDRPIKLVVPFPPGGGTDVVGRLVAQKLSEALGVPVVVENRPGADTQIGTAAVAKSAPDGYTIGIVTPSLAINKSLYADLPYDAARDLAPIALVASTPFYLGVGKDLKVESLSDLIAFSKENSGKVTYSTASSIGYLSGELLRSAAGIEATHVPYKGSAASVPAVASGDVTYTIDTLLAMKPLVQAGKLKILAVSSPSRARALPEVPTMSEAGLQGFQIVSWWGIVAAAGTPADVVGRLSNLLGRIMLSPDVQQRLESLGAEPNYGPTEKFRKVIAEEIVRYQAAVKAAKLEAGR